MVPFGDQKGTRCRLEKAEVVAAPATVSGETTPVHDHWETGKIGVRR
jgi:hypothetical protein